MPTKNSKRNIQDRAGSEECISDDLLFRFLEGNATDAEQRIVKDHLDTCPRCLDTVVSFRHYEEHPLTEEEKEQVKNLITYTAGEQADKIVEYYETLNPFDKTLKKNLAQLIKSSFADNYIWRTALAASIFLLIIIGTWQGALFFTSRSENTIQDDLYVYDNKAPYEYRDDGFRDSSGEFLTDSLYNAFRRDFKLGISDYVIWEYERAIQIFDEIEAAANSLLNRSTNIEVIHQVRDFYFYKGLCHFALFRSERRNLDQNEKVYQISEAIKSLSRADSLALTSNMENQDREAFFLGLAYGFSSDKDSASDKLGSIQEESRFYDQSIDLFRKWSKN